MWPAARRGSSEHLVSALFLFSQYLGAVYDFCVRLRPAAERGEGKMGVLEAFAVVLALFPGYLKLVAGGREGGGFLEACSPNTLFPLYLGGGVC